jgi:hypothetical protein
MTTADHEYFDARFEGMREYIDARFQSERQYSDARFAELKAELHQTIAQTVKWSAGIASATLALFVTLVAFVMNNAVPRTVPAATAQAAPAPIVIVIPPAALVQAPRP